jgi:hypothetical protein
MMLRLDPRLPLVWRSPNSFQIGIDTPLALVEKLPPGAERLIEALASGITRSGYDVVARAAGVHPDEAERLLHTLTPAFRSPSARAPSAAVLGSNTVAREIAAVLADAGRLDHDADRASLVVLVEDWVIAPGDHGAWLRRDVPHLPVVVGDIGVTIGPLVRPGRGPCLYCVHLARVDADPAWPAIASQLWGRPGPAISRLAVAEAAALTARRLRFPSGSSSRALSWRIDRSGRVTPTVWWRHPSCRCAAPPGSDWAPEDDRARPGGPN